eukprot:6700516-Lingulodinium_polyedra.AAC.1
MGHSRARCGASPRPAPQRGWTEGAALTAGGGGRWASALHGAARAETAAARRRRPPGQPRGRPWGPAQPRL